MVTYDHAWHNARFTPLSGRPWATTAQLRAPELFHNKTLWPEYLALAEELDTHLDEITTRVIREAINDEVSEPASAAPMALPPAT